ncbi:MAG: 1-hydroxycarotenoid 3,4-desaturase CrtD [Mucilaginibacter sp.]
MSKSKVIIIGSGIAGIATAIRLAVKGYSVEVFETNDKPGGKLAEISNNGYRFDAGPSLLTMPNYIDELFLLTGKQPADYFRYQRLATICNYFYEDGTRITAYADEHKLADEISRKTTLSVKSIEKHINYSKKLYWLTHSVFLEHSLSRIRNFLRWDAIKALFNLYKIDTMRTMHEANKSFFKDSRIVQFFDRYATYNGSNPYQAPATLNVIPHLEQHFGAYFPEGGMYNIVSSLVKLAEGLGVHFHYNSPVDEIILKDKKATGIKAGGQIHKADIIVSNADLWPTYKKLLRQYPHIHPQKNLQQERSSSALIFYWGIKKKFTQLDLHNIFFSADYKAEFDHLWQQKTIYIDPTVYINISSKQNHTDAPEGCENWFVMINAPANSGQDWEVLTDITRRNIITKLSRLLGEDISRLIVCEDVLDPRGIESKTSSYQGSIYGTSSNSRYAAFLRHANRSSKIKDLYFCGGSVHPGGGIPLCLLSAKIVSDWISPA